MIVKNFLQETKKVILSRAFLVVFVCLLSVSLSVAYVASEPQHHEKFLSISTLGSDMMAENYYPKKSSTLDVGDHVKWFVDVYNRMGSTEYVSVRIKLLNSTETMPDDSSHIPSPKSQIYEEKHVIMSNSTWTMPLNWVITEVDKGPGYTMIKGLSINSLEIHNLDVKSVRTKNYRLALELWRYDPDSKDFVFGWNSNAGKRSAWNQIWFNVR